MDRIEAAEAILATIHAARGRMSLLAHTGLPFDRAVALEISARVGASPERVSAEMGADLLDRRLALARHLRGRSVATGSLPMGSAPTAALQTVALPTTPAQPVPVVPAPSLPVSSMPVAVFEPVVIEERIDDEPTPIQREQPEVQGIEVIEVEYTVESPAPDMIFILEEEATAAEPEADIEQAQAPVSLISADPEEDELAAELAAAELAAELAAAESAALEQDPDPEIPLVRFRDPEPRAEIPLVRFHEAPVSHDEALGDESTQVSSAQLLDNGDADYDDQILDEAVEAALDDEDPSISGELDLDGPEEALRETPTELGALLEALRVRGAVDGDNDGDADDSPDETRTLPIPEPIGRTPVPTARATPERTVRVPPPTEPPARAPTRAPIHPPPPTLAPSRYSAAVTERFDEERTIIASTRMLAELDPVTDEEEAPPARPVPRPGAAVQIGRPVRSAPEGAAQLEAPPPESEDDGEESRGHGFSVTLERPQSAYEVEEDEEPSSVVTLPSSGPRLTDDADMGSDGGMDSYSEPTPVDPRQVAEFLQKAREAEGRGDLARAILHYRDLLDLTPESVEAALGRGRCLMEMGDYAAAMSDFQRAEDLDQRSPEPLVEMGNLFFARKEYRRAIEFYDQAIEIDPTHAMARCRRGISHHYRKNHKQAFQDLQRAYSLNPDIPNIRKYVQMAVKAMEKSR